MNVYQKCVMYVLICYVSTQALTNTNEEIINDRKIENPEVNQLDDETYTSIKTTLFILEEISNRQTPTEQTPKKQTSKESTPKKETPKRSTPKKQTPKEATPKKQTPKESTPKKETPKKSTPKKQSPKESTPKKQTLKKPTPKKRTSKPTKKRRRKPQFKCKDGLPHFLSFQKTKDTYSSLVHECVASLILPQWILTTQKCCKEASKVRVVAGLGKLFKQMKPNGTEFDDPVLSNGLQTANVVETLTHFLGGSDGICLGLLDKPLEETEEVTRVTMNVGPIEKCDGRIYAFSKNLLIEKQQFPIDEKTVLTCEHFRLLPKCDKMISYLPSINFCGYKTPQESGVCYGDLGGPIMCKGVLVGITTKVNECTKRNMREFLRIDAYYSWISDQIYHHYKKRVVGDLQTKGLKHGSVKAVWKNTTGKTTHQRGDEEHAFNMYTIADLGLRISGGYFVILLSGVVFKYIS